MIVSGPPIYPLHLRLFKDKVVKDKDLIFLLSRNSGLTVCIVRDGCLCNIGQFRK
jgi:hypothetical protein